MSTRCVRVILSICNPYWQAIPIILACICCHVITPHPDGKHIRGVLTACWLRRRHRHIIIQLAGHLFITSWRPVSEEAVRQYLRPGVANIYRRIGRNTWRLCLLMLRLMTVIRKTNTYFGKTINIQRCDLTATTRLQNHYNIIVLPSELHDYQTVSIKNLMGIPETAVSRSHGMHRVTGWCE